MKPISQKQVKHLLLASVLFVLFPASAQQANLASGGNATGTNGTSSYSIGQVVYANQEGTNGSVNQGVEQPFEIFTLGNDDFPEITLQMSVYPNPTASFVNLNIQNYEGSKLEYRLYDMNGRQLSRQKITQSETQITMEILPSAVYILNVSENNKQLKSFKIIKNN